MLDAAPGERQSHGCRCYIMARICGVVLGRLCLVPRHRRSDRLPDRSRIGLLLKDRYGWISAGLLRGAEALKAVAAMAARPSGAVLVGTYTSGHNAIP